jgi:hypothetical protein
VRDEEHADIHQERQAQPFEDAADPLERSDGQRDADPDPGSGRPERGGPGMNELHALPDGHEVGREVEAVRQDECDDEHDDGGARAGAESAADEPAEAVAGRERHAIAHLLRGHHERQRDGDGPQQAVAVHRTGLRIGGDTRWVVVGGSGHEPRAEHPEESEERVLPLLLLRAVRVVPRRRALRLRLHRSCRVLPVGPSIGRVVSQ